MNDGFPAATERAFEGEVLFVGDGECSNTIAFAGRPLAKARPGPLRRPRQLDRLAWDELTPAFARVAAALSEQRTGS